VRVAAVLPPVSTDLKTQSEQEHRASAEDGSHVSYAVLCCALLLTHPSVA